MKKLIVDVFYYPPEDYRGYKVVGVLIDDWNSSEASEIICITSGDKDIKAYIPGKFKERELPCITRLLKTLGNTELMSIDTIIVDGYVDLSNETTKIDTLGTALYDYLSRKGFGHISIIGIAKTKYHDETLMSNCIEVHRGKEAINPLYVSSIGLGIDNIKIGEKIKSMYGEHRLPAMIKLADKETKLGALGF